MSDQQTSSRHASGPFDDTTSGYDHELYMRTLADFIRALLTPYDTEAVLTELADRVTEVFGLVGCGVSLGTDDRLTLDVARGDGIADLEAIQDKFQTGPCVDAFRTGERVVVADLTAEAERWPKYCEAAGSLGIASMVSIPMRLGDSLVGATNLYADASRTWPEEDLNAATVLADMATAYVINASMHRQEKLLNEQLQRALENRVVIEQAKGMVAARHHISPDAAYERLRAHARNHNAAVRDVCGAVVELGLQL